MYMIKTITSQSHQSPNSFLRSIIILIVTIFSSNLQAQNYIYIGTNRYPSTNSFDCTIVGGFPELGNATIAVAKSSKGGYFILSVDTHHPLKGDVYIYLDNGEVIRCVDTKTKDMHDGYSIGIYNLTFQEIEKLKKSNISSVRASCWMYSSSMFSFTVQSFYYMETLYGDKLKMHNTTAEDIRKLMMY